jgi:hypothetical protein
MNHCMSHRRNGRHSSTLVQGGVHSYRPVRAHYSVAAPQPRAGRVLGTPAPSLRILPLLDPGRLAPPRLRCTPVQGPVLYRPPHHGVCEVTHECLPSPPHGYGQHLPANSSAFPLIPSPSGLTRTGASPAICLTLPAPERASTTRYLNPRSVPAVREAF